MILDIYIKVNINGRYGLSRTPKTTLGSKLRELRQNAELSLNTVATAAKISTPYLSQLERDLANPSDKVVFDLAGALKCEPDELMAILGRVAEDLREVIFSNPAEMARHLLTLKGFSGEDISAVTRSAEKLRTKLGLPPID